MRASVVGAVAWLLLGCFALVSTVRADAPSDGVAKLVDEGLKLRTEGRDAEALKRFEEAYAQRKEPRTLAQIALAEQALGRWAHAHAHLTEALAQRDDAWINQWRGQLGGSLERIESELGSIEVVSNVAGSVVSFDGHDVGTTPLPHPIRAFPASIVVRVRAPAHLPFEQTVSVTRQKQARVAAVLRAEPAPEPKVAVAPAAPPPVQAPAEPVAAAPQSQAAAAPVTPALDLAPPAQAADLPGWRRPSVLLGVAGAGTASMLVAAATYAVAGKKTNALEKDCYKSWCEDDEREDRRGTVKTLDRTSRAFFALGLSAVLASGITYLVSRNMKSDAPHASSTAVPVSLGASFDRSSASVLGTMEF